MPSLVTNCPCCGGDQRSFVQFACVRNWSYVRCPRCTLVFLDPMPTREELQHFYQKCYHYDQDRYRLSVENQPEWIDMLGRQVGSPGRLLEVGCSFGYFLRAAQAQGWQTEGIELSESAVKFAREQLGLQVRAGILQELVNSQEALYDAVVAWHVVEHEMDPGAFFTSAFRALRPGGTLALRVPNLDSRVAALAGTNWQWLSPPEHTYMFSSRTLSFWLSQTGFEIVLTTTARGNARNMWFETLRARTKELISRLHRNGEKFESSSLFSRPSVYENRMWYRAAEGIAEIVSSPIDRYARSRLARSGREAELVVIARRSA